MKVLVNVATIRHSYITMSTGDRAGTLRPEVGKRLRGAQRMGLPTTIYICNYNYNLDNTKHNHNTHIILDNTAGSKRQKTTDNETQKGNTVTPSVTTTP